MFYVLSNHINNLFVLSNKAVGPGKNPKLINVGPTFIPDYRVDDVVNCTPQDLYTMTLVPIQNLATAIEQMTPKNLLLRVFFYNSKQLMWSVKSSFQIFCHI